MKKIKPVIQRDLKDCGVCCMQWIIIYYDGYISLEKLRDDTLTNINGTSAYHIVEVFKKWGFDSYGVLVNDLNNIELKFPFIAHLTLENGLEHFVVVKEFINNIVYLMDPGIGYKKMNLNEFSKVFTGHVVIAYPKEKIVKLDRGIKLSNIFLNILFKEKFLVFKILLTSFVWTILLIINSYYLKVGSNLIISNINILKYLIISFGIFTFLKVFTSYIRDYYQNHLNNIVDTYIYPEFLRHLFSLPLKVIKSRTTGEIVTRIGELSNIKSLFTDIFVTLSIDSIMLLISIVILYIISKKLSIILFMFLFIYIIIGIISNKIMYKKVLENINYQTDFNSLVVENIDMFESIKNLNIVNIILKRIEKKLSKFLLNNYYIVNCFNNINLFKDFIIEIGIFLVNSYGFLSINKGNLSIVDLFTFNIIISYLLEPIKNIINMLPKYNYIKATFSKISEFISIEEEKYLDSSIKLNGSIKFKNVCYSYNNYNYILNKINFKINECEHVLIDGESGTGKSTICKLIYKEYDSFNGDILIDNINIKDINLSDIRNNIIYISQQEKLFTGSIKDNILIDRNIDEKIFKDICKLCYVDKIVSKKNVRFESIIDSFSKNISGGEAQRIILARGLLKNANIIILDEALSEVDGELESKIIKNIRKYFHDKTIIYISHKNQKNSFEKIIKIGG